MINVHADKYCRILAKLWGGPGEGVAAPGIL
jgi:hypothetical protein